MHNIGQDLDTLFKHYTNSHNLEGREELQLRTSNLTWDASRQPELPTALDSRSELNALGWTSDSASYLCARGFVLLIARSTTRVRNH